PFSFDCCATPCATPFPTRRSSDLYGRGFEVYFPETAAVEAMESSLGPNLFYRSLENRRRCCQVRKIAPLARALGTLEVWITGLRSEEHTSELQSRENLVCRLLLEK